MNARGALQYTPANGRERVLEELVTAAPTDPEATRARPSFNPATTRQAVTLTTMFLGLSAALRTHEADNAAEASRLVEAVRQELDAAGLGASDPRPFPLE